MKIYTLVYNKHIKKQQLTFNSYNSFTNMFCKKHHKKWNNKIIYSLHITTGRMTDRPNKQDTFKKLDAKQKRLNNLDAN